MCLGYSHIVESYHRLVPGLTPPQNFPMTYPVRNCKLQTMKKKSPAVYTAGRIYRVGNTRAFTA